MIHLWRGYHSLELPALLSQAWKKQQLVILVPNHLKDFNFLQKISAHEVSFQGDWSEEIITQAKQNLGNETHVALQKARLGVFTSGTSSGINRLVFYSEENVTSSLSAIRELFDTKRIRKIFCYPQPTHTFGLVLGYLQATLNHLELHFSPGAYSQKAHEEWFKVADAHTLTLGAPAHFLDLIQYVKTRNIKVPASYSAIVGGARVTGQLWDEMHRILSIEAPSVGYGATEASPGVTHLAPGIRPSEDGDIGYALKNIEIQISEQGLEFKGPHVCYLVFENQQFKTNEKILLKDSIVTAQSPSGTRYTYLGRTDLMINRGGIKFSLEVVEATIATKLAVKCAAASLFDQRLGDELGLIIQSENAVEKQKIQDLIKSEWGFKLDDSHILFKEIPLNQNGKINRTEVVKLLLKNKKWDFPFQIENLRSLLPHKGPAIWVDSILETRPKFGVVRVNLQSSKNYFTESKLRETACIEWTAQAYGYVVALNDILDLQKADSATRTFIAEVKSAEFNFDKHEITNGPIDIKVNCTHDFGVLKVVEGQIYQGINLLAAVNMKLYSGS